ncbi:MAG: hypothetical protein JNL33_09265 [Betaproteobacteria bacterium]|nr:hypothetical protein [Betaproteobacteria bacterium]
MSARPWSVGAALAALALVMTGCADPARNVYEGVRTRDTTMQTPMERSTQPAPTYEDYERERRKAGGQ